MGAKPKARKTQNKKSDAEKQKEQSARFIKAAREFGVDETGKDFASAIKKIAQKKPR